MIAGVMHIPEQRYTRDQRLTNREACRIIGEMWVFDPTIVARLVDYRDGVGCFIAARAIYLNAEGTPQSIPFHIFDAESWERQRDILQQRANFIKWYGGWVEGLP